MNRKEYIDKETIRKACDRNPINRELRDYTETADFIFLFFLACVVVALGILFW